MSIFLSKQDDTYSTESFRCRKCGRDFNARIITWVDVARIPKAKKAILEQEFNIVSCTHCGNPQFAETPFFYEDFAEGLLVAVFPQAPKKQDSVEAEIRSRYGFYPIVECFYDMARIWLMIYLQNFFKNDDKARASAKAGKGMKAIKLLRLLKEDPLMAAIKEKVDDILSGAAEEGENLAAVLGQAVLRLEGLHPWPLDRRCVCGADLSRRFKCCGGKVGFNNHELLSSRPRMISCPTCGKTIASTACGRCGRIYTWELGIVDSYDGGEDYEGLFYRVENSLRHTGDHGM